MVTCDFYNRRFQEVENKTFSEKDVITGDFETLRGSKFCHITFPNGDVAYDVPVNALSFLP